MPTTKRYEILDGLPGYGPMYISISESGEPFYSEGFVVRFYKDNGTDWVANFKPGWTKLKQVIELKNSTNLLVIALGECYLMNPNDTKPISVFGVDYSNVFTANNKIVLQATTSFTIVKQDGTHWNTERISWDEFKDVAVENDTISGLAYTALEPNEWTEFSYNIETKILIGGSWNWEIVKKPWWKFW
jgi:hypothetical protein